MGRKGTLGSVYYSDVDYWPHDTSLWVKDFKGNEPKFVYYFFKSISDELKGMDVGAANPALNRNHVHPIEITWPSKETQEFIVKQLSALDELIDNNCKTSRILEQIAQAIFKSWFVDFDPTKAKIAACKALLAENPTASPEQIAIAEQQAAIQVIAGAGDVIPTEQLQSIADLFPNQFIDSELGEIPYGWKSKL